MRSLKALGVTLALDDFGAGYTSFNYLKEIPADFIKIDGSFVRDINSDPANYAITRTIVDLTHELGMHPQRFAAESPHHVMKIVLFRQLRLEQREASLVPHRLDRKSVV